MRPKGPRDLYAGAEEGPVPPFPIKLSGPVIKGFGRGSRELGIPTANIPPAGLSAYPNLQSGVYFGFVGLSLTPDTVQPADNSKLTLSASASSTTDTAASERDSNSNANTDIAADDEDDDEKHATPASSSRIEVHPAVLSIGYNLFYNNPTRSVEIHVLHPFPKYNFYHAPLNLLILGFIRPEYDYESLEALVDDIRMDCEVARRSLERRGYAEWKGEGSEAGAGAWLREFGWMRGVDVGSVEGEVLMGDKDGVLVTGEREEEKGKDGEQSGQGKL